MKEIVMKYTQYLIALALILFFVARCVNGATDKYIGEGNVYEKQLKNRVEILKQKEAKSKKTIDSLHAFNAEKDSIILGLKKKNEKLVAKVVYIGKTKDAAINKVASFTHKQSADFIAEKLDAKTSVVADSSGVVLKDDAPNKVAKVIVEKEACEEEAAVTKQIIANSEAEKEELNKKLDNKDKEIQTVVDLNKEKDLTLEASRQANESFTKQNKTLRTVRTIDRIIIIGGIITGFFILK